MRRTARMAVLFLAFTIAAWMNAQPKPAYTTLVIDYVGKTDRPVFPIIISGSADEAEWYTEKLFSDPVSAFVHEYIVRESTLKNIADIPLPNNGNKRKDSDDRPRTSPALRLVIARGHDSHEATLEAAESVSFLGEIKKRVSEYPPLVEQLSDIEGRMNRYQKKMGPSELPYALENKLRSSGACRKEKFLNEESITYRDAKRCNLLILRPKNSISDRLSGCPFCPSPKAPPPDHLLAHFP